jgi:hypothetical protein
MHSIGMLAIRSIQQLLAKKASNSAAVAAKSAT